MMSINDRCPLASECEKRFCSYYNRELSCIYYETNARPGYYIEDQEDIRREKEKEALERSFEAEGEAEIAPVPADDPPHPARTLDMVAAEIRALTCQALTTIIEIGRRMVEAKEMLPHGSFGPWIKEQTGYSQSTANNFMKLYEEYGAAQGSLFGAEVECQTFGNLSYTKALALLAVPSDEREEFAIEHDVNAMSTRELKQAIKERDEAKKALEEEREASEGTAIRIGELEEKASAAKEEARKAKREAEEAQRALKEIMENPPEPEVIKELDTEELARYIEETRDEERAKLNDELCKADEAVEKAKKKAAAAEKAAKEAEARAKEAEERAADAIKKAEENAAGAKSAKDLAGQLEEVQKELAMADPVTAEFKGLFASVADNVARLVDLVDRAPETTKGNLQAAMAALAAQIGGTR